MDLSRRVHSALCQRGDPIGIGRVVRPAVQPSTLGLHCGASREKARRIGWKPWLPTRGAALAWLALRQSVPLCLPGLALACLLNLFSVDTTTIHYEYDEAVDATELTPEQAATLESTLPGSDDVVMIEQRLVVDYPGDASELPTTLPLKTEELPVEMEENPPEARIVRVGVPSRHRFKYLWQSYRDSLSSSTCVIGGLWAVVVGAGLFSSELGWRVGEFWRTRPISPAWLFAIKFAFGLLAVLLVLDGTVIAAAWNSPHWGEYHAMNWAYFASSCRCTPRCLPSRSPGRVFCARGAGRRGGSIDVYWNRPGARLRSRRRAFSSRSRFTTPGAFLDRDPAGGVERYPVVAAAMVVMIVASILIGWLALRRYDPRRQTG